MARVHVSFWLGCVVDGEVMASHFRKELIMYVVLFLLGSGVFYLAYEHDYLNQLDPDNTTLYLLLSGYVLASSVAAWKLMSGAMPLTIIGTPSFWLNYFVLKFLLSIFIGPVVLPIRIIFVAYKVSFPK